MFLYAQQVVQKCLGLFGLELARKGFLNELIEARLNPNNPRATMYQCLSRAATNGLSPATILDVGAARGTDPLYELFPGARFILIEPLQEFAGELDRIVKGLGNAEYIIGAATSRRGSITINVHPDLVGTSIYKEGEDSDVNGVERVVPTLTLDEICSEKGTPPPYLIKVDTQGSEIEVLKGARNILPLAEFVILEVSLFEFYKGAPLIGDCIEFMLKNGFAAYDVFDLQYRKLDGAMSQVDIAFVKDKGLFREHHFYANREQRAQQDREFGVK